MKNNGFAKGGEIGGLIRKSPDQGFILAKQGEHVLTANDWKFADHMATNLMNFAKIHGSAVNKNNVTSSAKIDTVEMNINLPNVNNYEDFKNALVRDRHIQNIIQDITIGNALGKNSLNKYRHK